VLILLILSTALVIVTKRSRDRDRDHNRNSDSSRGGLRSPGRHRRHRGFNYGMLPLNYTRSDAGTGRSRGDVGGDIHDIHDENEFFVNFENTGFEVRESSITENQSNSRRSISSSFISVDYGFDNEHDFHHNDGGGADEFFFHKDAYEYYQEQQQQQQQLHQKNQSLRKKGTSTTTTTGIDTLNLTLDKTKKKWKEKEEKHSLAEVHTGFELHSGSKGQSLDEWIKSIEDEERYSNNPDSNNAHDNNSQGKNSNYDNSDHSEYRNVTMERIMTTSLVDLDSDDSLDSSEDSGFFDGISNHGNEFGDNQTLLSRVILGQGILRRSEV